MNDATPRRLKGSLLERAAERYELATAPVFRRAAGVAAVGDAPAAPPPIPARFLADPVPVGADTPRARPRRPAVAIDREALAERGFLLPGGPVTPLAEEFRLAKRHVLSTAKAIGDAAAARRILVCSARPNDGKTFCAINLALSMAAERDVEVLLVDADFAKPDVAATLGLDEGLGLLDALADPTIDVEDLVVPTDVPKLSILRAGTRSSSDTELLASERGRALVDALSVDPRRIVIFDSPPVLAASPAGVLASRVGQAVLVVRADVTAEGDLRDAVGLIDACDHVQLLLNAVSFQPGGRRFGDYYGAEGER